MKESAKLSVNINKIATLRNSRGKNLPDVARTAQDIVAMGAEGITVHPRPDERHIRKQDVYELKKVLTVEFNIEGYPGHEFMEMIERVRPEQCTLVPDPPNVLTSNAGWKIAADEAQLSSVVSQLRQWRVRSSLFVDPFSFSEADLLALSRLSPDRIELYTESFAVAFKKGEADDVIRAYQKVASQVREIGIEINAGHDLNQENLGYFARSIPELSEVSIGHALICEALYDGLSQTIRNYLELLRNP